MKSKRIVAARRSAVALSLTVALILSGVSLAHANSKMAASQPPAPQSAATASTVKPRTDVAAIVDGHTITMDEVTELVMRENGANATQRLIDNYLLDRAAKENNIIVSQDEIDAQIKLLLQANPGMTLEEGLKRHHQTREQLENDIRHWYIRVKLVSPQVKPGTFVHARLILIKSAYFDANETSRTDEQALEIVKKIHDELKSGKSFEDLAKQYNEDPSTKETNGDTGVLYTGAPYEGKLIDAALTLKSGDVTSDPVKSRLGYYVIQALSTGSRHPDTENQIYADATTQYTKQQAQMLIPDYMNNLRAKSNIVNNLPE